MDDQGGVGGAVLGVRDQVASLFFRPSLQAYPFALLDILLVAIILYYAYALIRETRAIRILYGLLVLGLLYVVAQAFDLVTLLFLLRSIFAVVLVAIPVVFQPELRAALERIGRTRFVGAPAATGGQELTELIQTLVKTLTVLAAKKTGALIVLEQHDSLREYGATGIPISGRVSSELLLTIFKSGSPLHDGAVILRGPRIEAASALLPVAGERFDSSIGTRHRAAIGISEETDAVALVVSEETGRISVAVEGQLHRNIRPAQLESVLTKQFKHPGRGSLSSVLRRLQSARRSESR